VTYSSSQGPDDRYKEAHQTSPTNRSEPTTTPPLQTKNLLLG
jgi:hypothetical protein